MKFNSTLILSIILAVGLVAYAFTALQIGSDRQDLNADLRIKTMRIAEDFYTNYLEDFSHNDVLPVSHIADSVLSKYSLTAVAVYYNTDSIIAVNSSSEPFLKSSKDFISEAIAADSSMGSIVSINKEKYFQYIKVIQRNN